jgi:hypothetical protein
MLGSVMTPVGLLPRNYNDRRCPDSQAPKRTVAARKGHEESPSGAMTSTSQPRPRLDERVGGAFHHYGYAATAGTRPSPRSSGALPKLFPANCQPDGGREAERQKSSSF